MLLGFKFPTLCFVCGRWQQDCLCVDCLGAYARLRPRCPRCALPVPSRHPAHEPCHMCEDAPPEFDRAVAALDYTAPWSSLIARLKFQQSPGLAQPLARLLAQAAAPVCAKWPDMLVLAMPLSSERRHERGYNQAALLAQRVAQHLQRPCLPDALIKRQHTARMMSLSAEARRLHVIGAFAVHPRHLHAVQDRHVAVVDDVMTTGATLNEVARTLEEAGTRSVSAWVLARTPQQGTRARAT